ncbi:MAG: hypothetical protein L7F78_08485 [Syntrophales bacterium LBB04]|nr:hypothetical protein [Syntrophales bacterium LBB04]
MSRMFIVMPCAFFVLLTSVYAQDIYIYKQKNGNIVITNTQIPEEYKMKAQKTGSSNYVTPSGQRQQEKVQEVKSKETYNPREVEKEKMYLEAEIKRLKNMESADSNKTQYYKYFVETYENHLQLLEKDPESYFSKQEQFAKEAKRLLR